LTVAVAGPKPAYIDPDTWARAQALNPDPNEYAPTLLSGAEALHSRLVTQQAKAQYYADTVLAQKLLATVQDLQRSARATEDAMDAARREQQMLQRRVLDMVRKVEICRARNFPLVQEERLAMQRVQHLAKEVGQLNQQLLSRGGTVDTAVEAYLQQLNWNATTPQQTNHSTDNDGIGGLLEETYKRQVYKILEEQRQGIEALKHTLIRDARDLDIVRNGIGQESD